MRNNMGVKSEITLEHIANTICMDKSYGGCYVLLEGESDELLFSKFTVKENCDFEILDGKENVLNLVEILNSRNFERVIAIVDKDYDWFENNLEKYPQNVLVADNHDIEIMCFSSESFNHVIKEFCSITKIKSLGTEFDLRKHLIELSKPIAYLRLHNKKANLGLYFKPNAERENELDYAKFICKNDFVYKGDDSLITTVKRYYSQAQHLDNEEIKKHLDDLVKIKLMIWT